MVSEAEDGCSKKDGKYLVYLPKSSAEDTMFPYRGEDSVFVKASFTTVEDKLLVEKWSKPEVLKS